MEHGGIVKGFHPDTEYLNNFQLALSHLLFFFLNWTVVDLQCCIISGVQPSDSVIYRFFFGCFSITVYYKLLNIVPCSTQ